MRGQEQEVDVTINEIMLLPEALYWLESKERANYLQAYQILDSFRDDVPVIAQVLSGIK